MTVKREAFPVCPAGKCEGTLGPPCPEVKGWSPQGPAFQAHSILGSLFHVSTFRQKMAEARDAGRPQSSYKPSPAAPVHTLQLPPKFNQGAQDISGSEHSRGSLGPMRGHLLAVLEGLWTAPTLGSTDFPKSCGFSRLSPDS